MKKLSLFVFVVAMMGSIGAMAQESRLSGEAGIDVYSKYIWRGVIVADVPSMQPGVSLSGAVGPGSLSFAYWGSSMLKESHADGDHSAENDYTVSYAFDAGPISVDTGVIYYTFPGATSGTSGEPGDGFSYTEVYASFGVGLFESDGASAGLSFAVYRDTDDTSGTYYNLGFAAEFAVTKDVTAGFSAGVGYGDSRHNVEYYSNDGDSIADIVIEGSVSMPLNDTFSLSAAIGYINVPNSDFDDGLPVAEDDFYAKVGISASF